MPDRASMAVLSRGLVLALVAVASCAQSANAHKINVFAHADGKTLHGEAYARGGEAIRGAKVEAFDPAGRKLGETVTDDNGNFTLEARFRCDHRLVVDAGGGHQIEYTLRADELPEALPSPEGEASRVRVPGSPVASDGTVVQHSHGDQSPVRDLHSPTSQVLPTHEESSHDELASLERQVIQLRRELHEYQQKLRLRDILGGIGYIVGMMGVAYYFLGVRKRDQGFGDANP